MSPIELVDQITIPTCRFCTSELIQSFVDLGDMPLGTGLSTREDVEAGAEERFRLCARVCDSCRLVQLDLAVPREHVLAGRVIELASASPARVEAARRFAAAMIGRFGLGPASRVIEVGSNDGTLLQYFRDAGMPVQGVEPVAAAAEIASQRGIPTEPVFFDAVSGRMLAARGDQADLLVAIDVLAETPDLRAFVAGLREVLRPEGVLVVQFADLLGLMQGTQFDAVHHARYSYPSLLTAERVLAAAGLRVFDVERLPDRGGSLRLFACRDEAAHAGQPALAQTRAAEAAAGLEGLPAHAGFGARVEAVREASRAFLDEARAAGKRVAAYGATPEGNTFLNACGIGADDIAFAVDDDPQKQGRLLPGSHIPVLAPSQLAERRPDYVLILDRHRADEIRVSLPEVERNGGRFVVAIPEIRLL